MQQRKSKPAEPSDATRSAMQVRKLVCKRERESETSGPGAKRTEPAEVEAAAAASKSASSSSSYKRRRRRTNEPAQPRVKSMLTSLFIFIFYLLAPFEDGNPNEGKLACKQATDTQYDISNISNISDATHDTDAPAFRHNNSDLGQL